MATLVDLIGGKVEYWSPIGLTISNTGRVFILISNDGLDVKEVTPPKNECHCLCCCRKLP